MNPHIMVIDDEPLICKLLEYQLGGAGYEVASFQRVHEAMLALARRQPDLILLDVMMPEISGWDLCRQIRSSSNIPIIMLTAKDGDEDVVRGLTGGADDYVGKPFNQNQLIARIEAVLRRAQAAAGRMRPIPAPAPASASSAASVAHSAQSTRQPAMRPRAPRLGAQFSAARQQRGLSLHDAGQACGVRWEFLQAIEQEEFGYVPRAELRHALHSYSTLLGVDLHPYKAGQRLSAPRPFMLVILLVIVLALVLVGVLLIL
ncbi:MAG: response regulator [Candidatus Viridilinea halotolerans]|uniref:Response regulator n=1 Tax=Candidatus Viridilinea halotolerans TaxID=2491704 RepID=A0A426U803_9CHLR|nr:MAG: response regulator [Candidatus Viridilinea halotolerans]